MIGRPITEELYNIVAENLDNACQDVMHKHWVRNNSIEVIATDMCECTDVLKSMTYEQVKRGVYVWLIRKGWAL